MYYYLLYIVHIFQCVCVRAYAATCNYMSMDGLPPRPLGPVKAAKAAVSETRQISGDGRVDGHCLLLAQEFQAHLFE